MVICQDDARNTTGCGKGHLQDGESAAIRTIARPGWSQDTSTDWEGDIPKDQDKVRDRREHCSSWTGLDDLRGRQLPSPFLYMHLSSVLLALSGRPTPPALHHTSYLPIA